MQLELRLRGLLDRAGHERLPAIARPADRGRRRNRYAVRRIGRRGRSRRRLRCGGFGRRVASARIRNGRVVGTAQVVRRVRRRRIAAFGRLVQRAAAIGEIDRDVDSRIRTPPARACASSRARTRRHAQRRRGRRLQRSEGAGERFVIGQSADGAAGFAMLARVGRRLQSARLVQQHPCQQFFAPVNGRSMRGPTAVAPHFAFCKQAIAPTAPARGSSATAHG